MEGAGFEIDVHALADLRVRAAAHTVLDVREPDEVAICALDGSIFIPLQQIPQRLESLPHDHPLIVLCHHGTRSAMVTEFLRNNGFDNARSLSGGIDAWASQVELGMPHY